jgi:hypothetical protein
MTHPASTPGRTAREPATRPPPGWDQDRPGDCVTSSSVPSDPLTGAASAGSARRPPPPDTGMIMIDRATVAAAYDGAAPSLRCWPPRGCTGREPPGAAGEHRPGMPPPARTCWPRACPPAISATGARCSTCWPVNRLLPLLGPGHLDGLRRRARPPRLRGRQPGDLTAGRPEPEDRLWTTPRSQAGAEPAPACREPRRASRPQWAATWALSWLSRKRVSAGG